MNPNQTVHFTINMGFANRLADTFQADSFVKCANLVSLMPEELKSCLVTLDNFYMTACHTAGKNTLEGSLLQQIG